MEDYRERIYRSYVTRGGAGVHRFDPQLAERWGRIYDRYFEGWLPRDQGAAVLDLACGNGNLLYFFKERGYRNLHGVDVSAEQVAQARRVVSDVVQASFADYLTNRDATFDLIVAMDVVEHLRKDEVLELFDACRRALRPGGRLIVQTPNGESPWGNAVRYGDFTHEICLTPGSISWLLSLTGFTEIQTRPAGPRPVSIRSAIRYVVWRGISAGLRLWNVAETGSGGGGIYTRVFLASAVKR